MAFTVPNRPDTDIQADQAEPDKGDFQTLGYRKSGVISGGAVSRTAANTVTVTPVSGYLSGEYFNITADTVLSLGAGPSAGSNSKFILIIIDKTGSTISATSLIGTTSNNGESATNSRFPDFDSTSRMLLAVVYYAIGDTDVTRPIVDKRVFVLPQAAEFEPNVDQPEPDAEEQAGQEVVDADGERHDVIELGGVGPAESRDVLFGDHRVFQLVRLVIKFDDGARQHHAFLDAEALGERAGGDITHDDFERDHLHFLDQLLAHVEAADEVGGNADLVQMREDVFADTVVQHALAVNDFMLLLVEGGRIVLEELDKRAWLRTFVEDLGLAFVNTAATVHDCRSLG